MILLGGEKRNGEQWGGQVLVEDIFFDVFLGKGGEEPNELGQ